MLLGRGPKDAVCLGRLARCLLATLLSPNLNSESLNTMFEKSVHFPSPHTETTASPLLICVICTIFLFFECENHAITSFKYEYVLIVLPATNGTSLCKWLFIDICASSGTVSSITRAICVVQNYTQNNRTINSRYNLKSF